MRIEINYTPEPEPELTEEEIQEGIRLAMEDALNEDPCEGCEGGVEADGSPSCWKCQYYKGQKQ